MLRVLGKVVVVLLVVVLGDAARAVVDAARKVVRRVWRRGIVDGL
mgnify:CR=1 FL=1